MSTKEVIRHPVLPAVHSQIHERTAVDSGQEQRNVLRAWRLRLARLARGQRRAQALLARSVIKGPSAPPKTHCTVHRRTHLRMELLDFVTALRQHLTAQGASGY